MKNKTDAIVIKKSILTEKAKKELEIERKEEIILKNMEEDKLDDFFYDNKVISFYSKFLDFNRLIELAEKQPTKIKKMIDELFSNEDSTEIDILKSLFFYFFELMGISDKQNLDFLVTFISKNDDEKKILKLFEDDIEVSFDKLVFFNQSRQSLN